MTMDIDPRVLSEALEDGLDDWVSLFAVAGYLSRHLGIPDEELCEEMRNLVTALVEHDLFEAGVLRMPHGFEPLDRPLDDVLSDICATWGGWADHSWWEALWLNLTEHGRAEGIKLFPEYG